jgi:hypothetical protein
MVRPHLMIPVQYLPYEGPIRVHLEDRVRNRTVFGTMSRLNVQSHKVRCGMDGCCGSSPFEIPL